MKKGAISLIELHLEKGVLGLTVLWLIFVGVRYLVLEPNKIEFGGERLGPAELDEAIQRRAEELQRAVRSAQPKAEPVPNFSQELEQGFNAGVLGASTPNAPPLPSTLRVVGQFGAALPKLEEGQEAENVASVTPLRPRQVVARTGISLVHKLQAALVPGTETAPPAASEGPVELSWVTVAAYYPKEAQLREMTNAGYAPYRAKVYVVGVDVQRQEVTPVGEYGPWEDVPPAKAIPKIDIPDPVYDDKSGELINQAAIDEARSKVYEAQQLLMQPWFYPLDAGDEWDVPPLPGLETEQEEEKSAEAKKGKSETEPPSGGGRAAPPAPPPPPSGGRGMAPPAGGGGRGMAPGATGGRTAGPFGGGGAAPPPPESGAKRAAGDLRAARKALKDKDWLTAEQKADAVLNNGDASRSAKSQAERIKREAQRGREPQPEKGPRTVAMPVWQGPTQLVTNPEKEGEPALWFHDDSVAPGKTYRYRLRVKLWNPYVGRRASLRDPALADKTVLVGEWSLPSAPITVAPRRHFFVRGPVFGEPAATVEVFTWHKGNWLKEDFKVRVGDAVGEPREVRTGELDKDDKPKRETVDFGTGALVLDLRFDEPVLLRRAAGKQGEFAYREAKTVALVYLDPVDGQVKERLSEVDRNDPIYKKVKDAYEEFRKEAL